MEKERTPLETEAWMYNRMLQLGRLVETSSGEIVAGPMLYEILGKSPPGGTRNLNTLVTEYLKLWPNGVKSGGYYVKSGEITVKEKFRAFFRKFHPYSNEDILKATKNYIDDCSKTNYQYMKTAEYFILKDKSSILESYCQGLGQHQVEDTRTNVRSV